jgi:hypothetical protein
VKGSHQLSALKRLYAAEEGIPIRTAQHHAKFRNPKWVAFEARSGAEALVATSPRKEHMQALVHRLESAPSAAVASEHVAPAAMAKPPHLRTPEEYAECETWECYVEANRQRAFALKNKSAMEALGYVRIAGDALKTYQAANRRRIQADMEAGRLKPLSAWHQVIVGLRQIAALISGQESELSPAANPENPIVARRAIARWREEKFGPAIDQMIQGLEAELMAA